MSRSPWWLGGGLFPAVPAVSRLSRPASRAFVAASASSADPNVGVAPSMSFVVSGSLRPCICTDDTSASGRLPPATCRARLNAAHVRRTDPTGARSDSGVLLSVRSVAPSPPHAGEETDRNGSGGKREDENLHNSGGGSRKLQEAVRQPERPHTDGHIEAAAGAGTGAILVDGRDEDDRPRGSDGGPECPVRDVEERLKHCRRSGPKIKQGSECANYRFTQPRFRTSAARAVGGFPPQQPSGQCGIQRPDGFRGCRRLVFDTIDVDGGGLQVAQPVEAAGSRGV